MSPEEFALYQIIAFDLGDLVEIERSEIVGVIDGMRVVVGDEDQYLIAYQDNCGNPQRNWWPASSLELVEEGDADDADSNVICFDCAKQAMAEARKATKH